jgi:hypothetical protein
MTEEWREVPGIAAYEVSSRGRIRRVAPYRSTFVGRFLKPDRNRNGGHLMVRLSVDGKLRAFYVHRLVALAFIGEPPSPEHQIAHEDGCPDHNWVENISWKTAKQNCADQVRHGTDPSGERNPNAVLTDLQVQLIRAHHAIGGTSKAVLSRLFGVSDTHISRIVSGAMRRQAGGYLNERTSQN